MSCATAPANKIVIKDEFKSTSSINIAEFLLLKKMDLALAETNKLIQSDNLEDQELGAYWKIIYFLESSNRDSAQILLNNQTGLWSKPTRAVHAEVFLRQLNTLKKNSQQKNQDEKIDQLAKETAELRTMIVQLQSEKKKYEKVLKELEKIR